MLALWSAFFRQHIDVSKPESLTRVVSEVFQHPADVKAIMAAANTPDIKKELTETTDRALKLGAFGAPFFSVTRYGVEGEKDLVEPFFGSDRCVTSVLLCCAELLL